ncbi:MAG: Acetyltransferase (GNAT) family protein [Firmicutes bacterium ADurb.Bin182]|nr:MAG: Acetyltransferase (GNAT) family protein [Firmicutes bacterium ADurb.Bin182]
MKQSEIPEIVQIQKSAFKRLYDIYHDKDNPYLKGFFEIMDWLETPGLTYRKIVADNTICGAIAYYNNAAGEYYLARIFVSPSYQRKGIGTEAVRKCELLFADAHKFTTDVPEDQQIIKAFFIKNGFTDTGERDTVNDSLVTGIYEKIVSSVSIT